MSFEELVVGVVAVAVPLVVLDVSVSSSEATFKPAASLLTMSALSGSLWCGVGASFWPAWENASVQTSLGSRMRGRCWKRGIIRARGWACVGVGLVVMGFSS